MYLQIIVILLLWVGYLSTVTGINENGENGSTYNSGTMQVLNCLTKSERKEGKQTRNNKPDYRVLFDKNWVEAETCLAGQRKACEVICDEFGVDTDIAQAVVFPELIRYSALRNFMETAAVKALYLQGGVQAANFSIGCFQMKPSFAEDVEREWMQTTWRHDYEIYFDLSSTTEARRARICRLDDSHWQRIYLALFLKLLYRRFPQLAKQKQEEQVQFCATAYNSGSQGTWEEIRSRYGKRFYHMDFIPTARTKRYAYPDIAVCFFTTIESRLNRTDKKNHLQTIKKRRI